MTHYVAQPFIAGSEQAEVIGQTMISFKDNIRNEVMEPVLEKHELVDIDEGAWYSHQLWMDILKDIQDTLGGQASEAFVAFGRQVVKNAIMPPQIQTIPDALNALHAIHHANLRNIPEEEGYSIEAISDTHYIVYHNTPNPEEAIYGFLWGLAARFKGQKQSFTVEKIENPLPEKARSAYEITWG